MLVLAITAVDFGVLALYLVAVVAIGAYFSREQRSSRDFFLAGRSMNWFPVGLSLVATLLTATTYGGTAGEAYFHGLKHLVWPLAVWLTVPLMWSCILPLYHGLGMISVYEYLELRFGLASRLISGAIFLVWRLLWLGCALYVPCRVLIVAGGLAIPEPLLLLVLGLVSTGYTFLGGMKAVIWSDVVQALLMAAGLLLIVAGVWWQMDGGAAEVWQMAMRLGRTQVIDARFDWTNRWSIWGMMPHVLLTMLSFYIADQMTVQRLLAARSLSEARRAFIFNCIWLSLMVAALAYTGLALLAFYQQHPGEMRPIWVINLESPVARRPAADPRSGKPLIDWVLDGPRLDRGRVDDEFLQSLIRDGRLMRPNLREPFRAGDRYADDLLDAKTRSLDIRQLAERDPRSGEWLLHDEAKDEFLPRFILEQLPMGVLGIVVVALLATAMSSIDSGLNSISTIVMIDGYRRLGWGRSWLARGLGKHPDQLTDADELKLGRFLVLLAGVGATVASLVLIQLSELLTVIVATVNALGGALLAVFLLGIFTRRTTGAGALLALALGALLSIWMMAADPFPSVIRWGPLPMNFDGVWLVIFGAGFTLIFGYGLSFLVGVRRTPQQLRGLVVGLGRLGCRDPEEASIAIPDFDQPEGE